MYPHAHLQYAVLPYTRHVPPCWHGLGQVTGSQVWVAVFSMNPVAHWLHFPAPAVRQFTQLDVQFAQPGVPVGLGPVYDVEHVVQAVVVVQRKQLG